MTAVRRPYWIDLFLLLLFALLLWAGFTYLSRFLPGLPAEKVSVDAEEKLGKMITDALLDDHGEMHTMELDSAMGMIGSRLMANIGLTDYEYHIYVIRSSEVNAFALPGGNVFVLSGLIEFCHSPEELAAVLAHEIGHVEKKHVIKRLVKEVGLSVLFSVTGGGETVVLEEIARTAASTVYDRKQEKEADLYGMDLLIRSGITPRVVASFFTRLKREKGGAPEELEFLMTHPNHNARIKAAMEYELPSGFKEDRLRIDWVKLQQSVREFHTSGN